MEPTEPVETVEEEEAAESEPSRQQQRPQSRAGWQASAEEFDEDGAAPAATELGSDADEADYVSMLNRVLRIVGLHAQVSRFDECAQAEQTNLCLEFGTYPMPQVIGASRAEHWLHRHGSSDPLQTAAIRQTLKDAFYPQADDWQQAVWQQGRDVFLQTLNGLRED